MLVLRAGEVLWLFPVWFLGVLPKSAAWNCVGIGGSVGSVKWTWCVGGSVGASIALVRGAMRRLLLLLGPCIGSLYWAGIGMFLYGSVLGRSGSDLLSRVLRRSTIGARGFHGRVRDGIGCLPPAITTRSSKHAPLRLVSFEA